MALHARHSSVVDKEAEDIGVRRPLDPDGVDVCTQSESGTSAVSPVGPYDRRGTRRARRPSRRLSRTHARTRAGAAAGSSRQTSPLAAAERVPPPRRGEAGQRLWDGSRKHLTWMEGAVNAVLTVTPRRLSSRTGTYRYACGKCGKMVLGKAEARGAAKESNWYEIDHVEVIIANVHRSGVDPMNWTVQVGENIYRDVEAISLDDARAAASHPGNLRVLCKKCNGGTRAARSESRYMDGSGVRRPVVRRRERRHGRARRSVVRRLRRPGVGGPGLRRRHRGAPAPALRARCRLSRPGAPRRPSRPVRRTGAAVPPPPGTGRCVRPAPRRPAAVPARRRRAAARRPARCR